MGGYSDILLHGEAISAGLLMAHEFSHAQGLCSAQDVERLRAHLKHLGMPTLEDLPDELTSDGAAFYRYMLQDKKNKNNDLVLILTKGIGRSFVENHASQDAVKGYLETVCGAATAGVKGS
jgi:3-dehydroquinate synthase